MHVTVNWIKQVLFTVDSLPADIHHSTVVKTVGFAVDFVEANEHVAVCVKTIGLAVDIAEAVREIFSVQEILPAAVDLFPSCHIGGGRAAGGRRTGRSSGTA